MRGKAERKLVGRGKGIKGRTKERRNKKRKNGS